MAKGASGPKHIAQSFGQLPILGPIGGGELDQGKPLDALFGPADGSAKTAGDLRDA